MPVCVILLTQVQSATWRNTCWLGATPCAGGILIIALACLAKPCL